jgi:hypothetical protein
MLSIVMACLSMSVAICVLKITNPLQIMQIAPIQMKCFADFSVCGLGKGHLK